MIKATLLLISAFIVIPRLRQRSAAERHLLWTAALAAATVLPVLGALLPAWEPAWARHVAGVFPPSAVVAVDGDATRLVVRATGVESAASLINPFAWLWIFGTAVALTRLAVYALKVARIARAAEPIGDADWHELASDVSRGLGLQRNIRLLRSHKDMVPVTWGVLPARVMLPERADGWLRDRRRAVLGHELAHVRRADWVAHIGAELACAVYWFHPLFWLARNLMSRESERAADDVVLAMGIESSDYAEHLLDIVRAARVRTWSPTLAMARPSELARRITALLTTNANRGAVPAWKAAVLGGLTPILMVPVASLTTTRTQTLINIRTLGLPPVTELSATAGAQNPSSVTDVRIIGFHDPRDAITPPEIAEYTTPPLYSDEARARPVEGIVTVGARVEADGTVSNVRIVRGLGFGLDQNAIVALRQWHFKPGTRRGWAAAMDAEIDVEFSLRNEAMNELIANDMATRVGPGVTPPRAIRIFAPPRQATAKRGTVVLDVVLQENGMPKIVRILRSLDPELDEGAVQNVAQWRFSPALKDGHPVKVRMNAEVTF